MKLQPLLLLILLTMSFTSGAQNEQENPTTDVTRATFLSPGFSYEKSIGKTQTLYTHLFLNPAISYVYSNSFGGDFSTSLDPTLLVQYRYYYNYKQRQQKEKRTDMNSLNYISPLFQTSLSKGNISADHPTEHKRRLVNTVGVVWGLQRNYIKRFSLDLNVGAGYTFSTVTVQGTEQPFKKSVGTFTLPGQLSLGFWLNKQL